LGAETFARLLTAELAQRGEGERTAELREALAVA
jgi:hypothetical protein